LFAVLTVIFSAQLRKSMIDLRKQELKRLVALSRGTIDPVLRALDRDSSAGRRLWSGSEIRSAD
jgi:hypothetical protein